MTQPEAVAIMARSLYRCGWMPGTSGNVSVRTPHPNDDQALITGSGRSKGELCDRDTVLVRIEDSLPVRADAPRPSAETTIHTALYRATGCAAIVHAHPPFATATATRFGHRDSIELMDIEDYELLKGFRLHDPRRTRIPVFPNWTDVALIGIDVERYLTEHPDAPPVLLIAAHGATAWGDNLAQARDRLECLESLCQLITLTGRPAAWPTGHQPPSATATEFRAT